MQGDDYAVCNEDMGRADTQFHAFLTLALEKLVASFVPWPLFSYNMSEGMQRTEGWLDPRAGMAAAQHHSLSLDYLDIQ